MCGRCVWVCLCAGVRPSRRGGGEARVLIARDVCLRRRWWWQVEAEAGRVWYGVLQGRLGTPRGGRRMRDVLNPTKGHAHMR